MKRFIPLFLLLVAGSLQLSAGTMKVVCCDGRIRGAQGIGLDTAKESLDKEGYDEYVKGIAETACGKESCAQQVIQIVDKREVEKLAKEINP